MVFVAQSLLSHPNFIFPLQLGEGWQAGRQANGLCTFVDVCVCVYLIFQKIGIPEMMKCSHAHPYVKTEIQMCVYI